MDTSGQSWTTHAVGTPHIVVEVSYIVWIPLLLASNLNLFDVKLELLSILLRFQTFKIGNISSIILFLFVYRFLYEPLPVYTIINSSN